MKSVYKDKVILLNAIPYIYRMAFLWLHL